MAVFKDSEGFDIKSKKTFFDCDMCDWGDGDGPILTINVPGYFETHHGEVYNSAGVLVVPLKDVLEEYKRDFLKIDGGHAIKEFAAYLRKYADKLEKKIVKNNVKNT